VRNHRHGVEEVGQQLLVPRAHPRCPHRLRWRRQGRREDRADLLRRKTVGESIGGRPRCPRCWRQQGRRKGRASVLRRKTIGESAGKHGRQERLLDDDPPPPGTRPHLNDANPGVEVEGPRGVAVVAVRDVGGGVAAGATTAASATAAASSAVVVPPVPRLSQVVVVSHWRWWRSTLRGGAAHRRRGTVHQGGDTTEGGWVVDGRPLRFGSSGSEKKNLSSNYHAGERCAAEY
jgi:hypothetical protein